MDFWFTFKVSTELIAGQWHTESHGFPSGLRNVTTCGEKRVGEGKKTIEMVKKKKEVSFIIA